MRTVAIIGAGPAGLTAAYELAKRNYKVEIFEAQDKVGGMCRTITLWGCHVDLGPHRFFSSDKRINELWLELAGNDYRMVNRQTRIFYKNRFFHYPLKPINALKNLGMVEALRCLLSYGLQKALPAPLRGDFESWVVNRFGKRLFSIFFKNYSEKLWGIKCSELDADFATQRIKKLSLYEAIKNGFTDNNGRHKTLVDQFAYPVHGTGMIYERMEEYVQGRGGRIFFNTTIKRVVVENHVACGIELENGSVRYYDAIVSTMPLTTLARNLAGTPANVHESLRTLRFRNTVLVYLLIDGKDLFADQWLYVHSPGLTVGRITNFRNWLPHLYGNSEKTILALELWCNSDDPMWHATDESLVDIAKSDLAKTGLSKGLPIVDGAVYRIPKCYPVYSKGYMEALIPVQQYFSRIANLYPIGRYGAFKYNNQDHSILMGMLAAQKIDGDESIDLWGVNTDYENYQESALITETGLKITTNIDSLA